MNLYRLIYEFAHAEHSRHREFLADKIAAKVISGQAVAHSLLKVAAYASYRNDIENELFARDQQHGKIGIAQYVADGLHPMPCPRFHYGDGSCECAASDMTVTRAWQIA